MNRRIKLFVKIICNNIICIKFLKVLNKAIFFIKKQIINILDSRVTKFQFYESKI